MVSYLYQEGEFRLLCHLCGGKSPVGGLSQDEARAAAQSLSANGVLMLNGREALVDPVTTFLFEQLASPVYVLELSSVASFYRTPKLFLRLDQHPRSRARRLTPMQTAQDALALLEEAMGNEMSAPGCGWHLYSFPDGKETQFTGFERAKELLWEEEAVLRGRLDG